MNFEDDCYKLWTSISPFLIIILTYFIYYGERRKNRRLIEKGINVEIDKLKTQNENFIKNIQNEIKQTNKKVSAEFVTGKRVEWIYMTRDVVAEFISIADYVRCDCYNNETIQIPVDISNKLRFLMRKMQLLFNFEGELDGKIIELASGILHNFSMEKFHPDLYESQVSLLGKRAQVYFKVEWERVKWETELNITEENDKKEMKQILKGLYKKYGKYMEKEESEYKDKYEKVVEHEQYKNKNGG